MMIVMYIHPTVILFHEQLNKGFKTKFSSQLAYLFVLSLQHFLDVHLALQALLKKHPLWPNRFILTTQSYSTDDRFQLCIEYTVLYVFIYGFLSESVSFLE